MYLIAVRVVLIAENHVPVIVFLSGGTGNALGVPLAHESLEKKVREEKKRGFNQKRSGESEK